MDMNSIEGAGFGRRKKPRISPNCTGPDDIKPLLVRPRSAWKMLGCGNTRGYELLAAGELDSFLDGGARKITVESIHRYIQRHLEGKEDNISEATS
jgi:hypothetical protein